MQAQDITQLGGELTTTIPGPNAIQLAAPNTTTPARRQIQISGFEIFHRSVELQQGLGPRFINNSCGGCHVENGRGPIRFNATSLGGSTVIIKVALRGLAPDGAPRAVPGAGLQLLDQSVNGRRHHDARIRWRTIKGRYPDGTRYSLRAPSLTFRVGNYSSRRLASSLRMSPQLIGMGLLEAIPESTILALSDPRDLNGDGISGRPMYVPNRSNGLFELGRFGFKGAHPTLAQQSAAAAFNDIGVTNQLFPGDDGSKELTDDELNRLLVYQQIAGVPIARNQADPQVIRGKELFQAIGCADCHRMSLDTGNSDVPELANQRIHPFTDLLLHDMGPGLADKRAEYSASGREWRTTPLWGIGFSATLSSIRPRYLHDGRARTLAEAILWHDGEARRSRTNFKALPRADREALIQFLKSL